MIENKNDASTRFSIVRRSKGQSAVEKASYISRSILVSESDKGQRNLHLIEELAD
ncbi:MAG: hypothetical protein K2I22_01110 [Lachnospiraceae bacterium]|nr:hypothetical protein [Lachnospiraceae bacterium]